MGVGKDVGVVDMIHVELSGTCRSYLLAASFTS